MASTEESLKRLKAWHAANPERVRQKNIRRVRERYEACVAEKICVHCRENDARPGKRACEECQKIRTLKTHQKRQEFIARGLNSRGRPRQKPGPKSKNSGASPCQQSYVENMTENQVAFCQSL